jgi:hypothetical protein
VRRRDERHERRCQSVSQCILGSRLSRVFTEQRRHYSTLLGPEKLVREPPMRGDERPSHRRTSNSPNGQSICDFIRERHASSIIAFPSDALQVDAAKVMTTLTGTAEQRLAGTVDPPGFALAMVGCCAQVSRERATAFSTRMFECVLLVQVTRTMQECSDLCVSCWCK